MTAAHRIEIRQLHMRCGVYTRLPVVNRILDAVGWTDTADLSEARLLEPAAGDGAFVVVAAERLIRSFRGRGIPLVTKHLQNRIVSFELDRREATRARRRLSKALLAMQVGELTATACVKAWVRHSDFLLTDLQAHSVTHCVGNPPYVRWSKVPRGLKEKYESVLSREMVGGDLFLPFLDRALTALRIGGHAGFVCSDRWRFMQFASAFREKWLPQLTVEVASIAANDAFERPVDAYADVLVARRRERAQDTGPAILVRQGSTLSDLGCTVRVGPALGHTKAYVLEADEEDIEPTLLTAWLHPTEVADGTIDWKGRRVATMHHNGRLITLRGHPLLTRRLRRFEAALRKRSIVDGDEDEYWYRTIDRVSAADWARPKILVPELALLPRCAIDESGAIPSHGLYAIFASDDDVERVYEKLSRGKLARALEPVAPRVKGGHMRCYKRILNSATFR
jgi:hypothetical protein